MEVPMVSAAGTRDARRLGVEPQRMAEVLGLARGYLTQPRRAPAARSAGVQPPRWWK